MRPWGFGLVFKGQVLGGWNPVLVHKGEGVFAEPSSWAAWALGAKILARRLKFVDDPATGRLRANEGPGYLVLLGKT